MKIEIVAYSPEWKNMFEEEHVKLASVLEKFDPVIEHIGSTSVDGLGAKPVIDVQVGMRSMDDLNACVDKMIAAGYIYFKKYEDTLPYRRYFVKVRNDNNDKLPTVLATHADKIDREKYDHLYHIHMVEYDSEWFRRHIAFREHLRKNDEARDAYYNLKIKLAGQDWNEVSDYADAKTEFIRAMEKVALGKMIATNQH